MGDARATQLGETGELNIGQLVRERHPDDALLVGFSTYTGTVTAASDWGAPARGMTLSRDGCGSAGNGRDETALVPVHSPNACAARLPTLPWSQSPATMSVESDGCMMA